MLIPKEKIPDLPMNAFFGYRRIQGKVEAAQRERERHDDETKKSFLRFARIGGDRHILGLMEKGQFNKIANFINPQLRTGLTKLRESARKNNISLLQKLKAPFSSTGREKLIEQTANLTQAEKDALGKASRVLSGTNATVAGGAALYGGARLGNKLYQSNYPDFSKQVNVQPQGNRGNYHN